MSFRRSKRRFRVGKREYMWTCTTALGGAIPSGGSTTALVDQTDWTGVAATQSLSRGATLTRIVGWWLVQANAGLSEDSAWASNCARQMISKNTTEGLAALTTTPLNLASATSYVTEDVLYMDGMGFSAGQSTDGITMGSSQECQRFDIRTKRKLTSDDMIILSLDVDAATSFTSAARGVWRCLIALP